MTTKNKTYNYSVANDSIVIEVDIENFKTAFYALQFKRKYKRHSIRNLKKREERIVAKKGQKLFSELLYRENKTLMRLEKTIFLMTFLMEEIEAQEARTNEIDV